jgi:hypothetical protein
LRIVSFSVSPRMSTGACAITGTDIVGEDGVDLFTAAVFMASFLFR